MKFKIANRIVFLRMKIYSTKDIHIGLDSGLKEHKGSHYILLDYDNTYPTDFKDLLEKFECRRGIIIESSPGKYHALSFTPLLFQEMISFMRQSTGDPKHLSVTIKRGVSTLRVDEKNGIKPRLIYTCMNMDGTRFYNYDAEKVYLQQIRGENK